MRRMGYFSHVMAQPLQQYGRQAAIDKAVKRSIACPGMTLKESAEVMLRHIDELPEMLFPLVIKEFRKIMKY